MRDTIRPLLDGKHQSPPKRRGGVWSLSYVTTVEPSLSREAGFSTTLTHKNV
jgi:hypothetical protein